jgi:undecaprenyl diphosphate synthase
MHLAIILDRSSRHPASLRALRRMIQTALFEGVTYLTLDAFSATDAAARLDERDALLQLLCDLSAAELEWLRKLGIRVTVVGDLDELPTPPRCALERLVRDTATGTQMRLSLALGYGGRRDIVEAARWLAARVRAGLILPEEIDEAYFGRHLSTRDLPPVDVLIRTGDPSRPNDSLLFESAHAKLVSLPSLWPDFDAQALRVALSDHSPRAVSGVSHSRGKLRRNTAQTECNRR